MSILSAWQRGVRTLFGASLLVLPTLTSCGGDDDDPTPPAGAAGKAGSAQSGAAGHAGAGGARGGQSGRGGTGGSGRGGFGGGGLGGSESTAGEGGLGEGGRATAGEGGEGGGESSGGAGEGAGASGEGGAAGEAGNAAGTGPIAGTGGANAGSGGVAGNAGTAGTAGSAGTGGESGGTNGVGGAPGGSAGTGGVAGTDGGAGTGGVAGSGGLAGLGGVAGTGGGNGRDCLFVTPEGDDTLASTDGGNTPFRNVQPAIDYADTHPSGPNRVCVAVGAECGQSAIYDGRAGAPLTMRNGISVYGGYESTTFTRCSYHTVTLRPGHRDGVYFGPFVSDSTVLDGFVIERFSATTTAGITLDGARGVTLTNVDVSGKVNATTSYGLDAKNGAEATLINVRVSSAPLEVGESRPPNQVGFRSIGATLTADQSRINLVGTSEPAEKNFHGVWLENSTGSKLRDTRLSVYGDAGTRVQGLSVIDSSNVVLDGTTFSIDAAPGGPNIGNGAQIVRSPGLSWRGGSINSRGFATEHGLWLDASPNTKLDVAVTLQSTSPLPDGIHVRGDATGSEIAGSLDISAPLSAGGVGIEDCGGSAFELDTSVLVRVPVGQSPLTSVDGIRVSGDCRPTISSDVEVRNRTVNHEQTLNGIRCTGTSRCNIDGSRVSITGAQTMPGALIRAVGVACDSGSCPSITRSQISGLSAAGELRNSRYRGGGVSAPGATLIRGNRIAAGCSGGGGVGLVGSGRIENNLIYGPTCGGSYLDQIAAATGLSVSGGAVVHSNTIFGGGASDGAAVGLIGCTSTAVTSSSGNSTFRNNILLTSSCQQRTAFARAQIAPSPNLFERNDLLASVLYLDGETAVTNIDAVNALFGPSALNFSADPAFVSNNGELGAASPCIDAGTSADAPSDDYLGQPRDARPDVGAVEFQGPPPPDPCAGVTCSGHGTCERQGALPVCLCDPHFTGPDCATQLDCSVNHGGCDPLTTCTATETDIVCGPCPSGYSGDGESGCVLTDACTGVSCQHGGRCLSAGTEHACLCPQGITGQHCELTFTRISAQAHLFCGERSDGSLRCWGDQDNSPEGSFRGISVGDFTCAIDEADELVCWDLGSYPPPPSGTFRSVAVGYSHACAIRTDGSVECWGPGGPTNPSGSFDEIAVGNNHACGIRTDGTLACWGNTFGVFEHGELNPPAGTFEKLAASALGTCAIDTAGAIHCWGRNGFGGAEPPVGTFRALTLDAASFGCAIRDDGTLACWGSSPRSVHPPAGTFSALAAGQQGACALRDDHVVVCWGYASNLTINAPNGEFESIPNACSHVSCNDGSCQYDGAVSCRCGDAMRRPTDVALRCEPDPCWFDNGGCDVLTGCVATDAGAACTACPPGFVGTGETSCVPADDHCAGVTCSGVGVCLRGASDYACACPAGRSGKDCELSFSMLSGRYSDFCGVRSDGTLSCWQGEFGPLSPPSGTFSSVTVGIRHACALDASGRARCFGDYGARPPPNEVLTAIAGIGRTICGLRLDGSVTCWGDATESFPGVFKAVSFSTIQWCGIQLDDTLACFSWGTNAPSSYVPPPGAFTSITSWNGETCGIRADGALFCWGFAKSTPVATFSAVTLGDDGNCGILTDGTLRCWNTGAPVIPAPGTFTAIAKGTNRTCAVRSDGTLICWGTNFQNVYPPNGSFGGVEAPCNDLACTNGSCRYNWDNVSCECNGSYRPTESRLACEPVN